MAIDLFCYTLHATKELGHLVSALAAENGDLFATKFVISKSREINELQQELALEFGLRARSMFLVAVNEKDAAGEVPDVAAKIRAVLGKDQVLILWENEREVS